MTARKSASQQDMNAKKIVNLGTPSSANDAARKADVDAAITTAESRANHTGTQTASTISDFATAVRTNRLDQMTAPTGSVSMGSQKITSLADPSNAQEAATKAYVDNTVSGLASGLQFKGAVKVAVATNMTVSNPATSTFDGVSLTNGDLVLLYGQTTGSQNGPYIFNGSAVGMTRAANWDAAGEAQVGSFWVVTQGTKADNFAIATNDTFVLGTDTLAVQFVGVAPSATLPFEADLGDGSSVSFTCTHNFGTKAVIVQVFRVASPYDEIDVYVARPTTNTITVEPDDVWSSGQMHVVISKA
jgi:hypothetical protein